MTVIGTLFAFVLVCFGIIILRKTDPQLTRPFRTPWVPVIPILGVVVCSGLIYTLGPANWLRLIIWLVIGMVIYFTYGRYNSRVQAAGTPNLPSHGLLLQWRTRIERANSEAFCIRGGPFAL